MVKWTVTFLLFFCQQATASSVISDYAFSADITPADGQLHRLQLPMEVLLNTTQGNLADIAVFDQNGNELPHTLVKASTPDLILQTELDFHTFDNFRRQQSKVVTTRQQNQQQGQLSEIEITEKIAAKQRVTDYLVELPQQQQLDYLELEWNQQPKNQMLSVRLEEPHWRRINKLPVRKRYLRITPASHIDHFELTGISGFYRQQQSPALLTHTVEYSKVTIQDNIYLYFETPVALPAEALRIVPGQPHSVIKADIYASSNDFEHKRQIRRGISQHNITAGDIEPSKPILLPQRRQQRHWWISLQPQSSSLPEIQLLYPQFEIIFLASDNPPFTVAWGNYQRLTNKTNLAELVKADLKQPENRGVSVSLQNVQPAGGISRLSAEPALPWKKWMLWILLVLATLVTGRMAYRLYRDMNDSSL
jgi:hypothetical protein